MARGRSGPHAVEMLSTAPYQPVPITREGYETLRSELQELTGPGSGEEPENATDDALERRAALEQRVGELTETLGLVYVVDPPGDGSAGIGEYLQLAISGSPSPIECRLVGPLECDPARGDISVESPIGKALLGHRAGEFVEVRTPGGSRTVEILSVR